MLRVVVLGRDWIMGCIGTAVRNYHRDPFPHAQLRTRELSQMCCSVVWQDLLNGGGYLVSTVSHVAILQLEATTSLLPQKSFEEALQETLRGAVLGALGGAV